MNDRRLVAGLFFLGLVLRLAGLPFNAESDIYQILLEWGYGVRRDGLIATFSINYGIFSYALYGLAARAADEVVRFWWAPYKLMIVGFDVAVLLALLRLAPGRKPLVLLLFWLNPWFILHEAYHGFWEGPHILFGLLAVLAAGAIERPVARWLSVGALLACSAMFKPQGLLYFIAPAGFYLTVQWLLGTRRPVVWYAAGVGAVFAVVSALIALGGGSFLAVAENYRSAFSSQTGISNGGPGIWRFVAFVYMTLTGQTGSVAFVKMPRLLIGAASAVAAFVCLAILALHALLFPLDEKRNAEGRRRLVLTVITLGSLVFSQFGVRAHINHSYSMMILLVPLVAAREDLRRLWVAMCALLGASHALVFALGADALLPPPEIFNRYPAAQDLIARVTALPAYASPDWPLRLQLLAADAVERLPGNTIVSLLSIPVFVIACRMVRMLFRSDPA